MRGNRRNSEAAQRAAARREREDAAPRLTAEVPGLVKLQLKFTNDGEGHAGTTPSYVRHVVVANAAALFLVPCGNAHCTDGGHDITHAVMRALKDRKTEFEGEDTCNGVVGSNQSCNAVLRFDGTAEYES
jgi:hypothetical protein